MEKIEDILKDAEVGSKYVNYEFQDFGLRLATELKDPDHKSLYIKLAKEEDRWLLEEALSFAKDYDDDSRAKLFMWKMKKLREERAEKEGEGESE